MIGASSLSGDTLIACHFPVVQLPTWQLPVQALCSSAKRPNRLCSAGLTRAVSLPEQNTLNREHTLTGIRRHFSSSYSSLNEDRVDEEGTSDSSGRYDSSSPEEASSHPKKESCGARQGLRSHNSFIPNTELDEEEEDEDSDGDNLHRYYEDSSFVLHGNSNWPQDNSERKYTISHGDVDSDWGNEGTMLGNDQKWLFSQPDQLDALQPEFQCCHGGGSGILMLACGEQDSDRMGDKMPCCTHNQHKCSPELTSNNPTDYVSDSSCNSSDGVLVNFCTIYNRSNNPAVPHDLSSPAALPSQSAEGSVFLNLQPVPQTPAEDLQHNDTPQKEEVSLTPSASCWSPQGLDSNCNLYSLEPLPSGLSSLEVSDLAACLQSQATLAIGTNQKYYKLVTCDLSSQSPSPAWSSLASCAEVQSMSSPFPASENKKKGQQKDMKKTYDYQVATTSTEKSLRRSKCTDNIQKLSHNSCLLCHSPCSPHSCNCQGTSTASVQASVNLDHEHCDTDAIGRGACASENPVIRYSKAQRPTFLPIKPIVLIPNDEPQAKHLGCLLEQYMNKKSNKSGSSQPGFKYKSKSSQCFSNHHPSPMSSHCPIFLEARSSSDTCSTCTPSPECVSRRHTWSQSSKSQWRQSPPKSGLVPTHTSPKPTQVQVSLSPPTTSKPQQRFLQHQAEPAADFHSRFTAALSSVGPFSSLSSLLSFAASGLHLQQTPGSTGISGKQNQYGESQMSDRPPADVCPSLDTSYESMSISHLQRRGLLRSVSRAVDLIIAHFGSSRDPDEKMRLGNSSRSPTIAGLVLEHLCPSIQNILEDGLRDHKLDVIIGQRRNHSWNVVEVSTRIGPSTRVLFSLVLKIRQYPQLTSPCMRLRAFIMGLLNLRALEFWLSHLQSQADVVTSYYHSWGFLSMSLGPCQQLFQELLLLLQPLSVLPFDLNLLLEPRLLHNRQLCPEEQVVSPPPPCSGLLVTSWPQLQGDHLQQTNIRHQTSVQGNSFQNSSFNKPEWGEMQVNRSQCLAPISEWWPNELDNKDCLTGGEDCSRNYPDNWSQISMDSRQEDRMGETDIGTPDMSAAVQDESPCEGGLRLAKLFGAAEAVSRTGPQTRR
ncbi:AP-4 complex accessory subunit RUSC2 [Aulostomus maculatus]